MKKILFALLTPLLLFPVFLHAQIENVIVETYYISDANDATDTTDGKTLEEGSVTYRIYIDLKPGSKIKKIFGDADHALKISSTAGFYNNTDRPTAYFGYLIDRAWFKSNPTIALDSWLTIGRAAKTLSGALKAEDTDGSIIGGTKNTGGSSGISGGLLINDDPAAGIPLTAADGLVTDTNNIFTQWFDNGFRDVSGMDTTVFGSVNTGSEFISNNALLQQNSGVKGAVAGSNKVLVAQLTTKGQISFELNLEIEEPGLPDPRIVKYVAKLADGETADDALKISPYLTYPQVCGCTDPAYLEYNARFACNDNDSCRTRVVFGCMDPMACNYNPAANFSIPSLCCYPGRCNDRDIDVVCPAVNNERNTESGFALYPNPAQNGLTLTVPAGNNENAETHYAIYNAIGVLVLEKNLGIVSGVVSEPVNISALDKGLYLFRLFTGTVFVNRKFVKN